MRQFNKRWLVFLGPVCLLIVAMARLVFGQAWSGPGGLGGGATPAATSTPYAWTHSVSGTAVTLSCTAPSGTANPSQDEFDLVPLTGNTTFTTPAAAACADNDAIWIKAVQGTNFSYTVAVADGAGTTHIITGSAGNLLQAPVSTGQTNYEVWYSLVYHASKTQWEIWSEATYPAQVSNTYATIHTAAGTAVTLACTSTTNAPPSQDEYDLSPMTGNTTFTTPSSACADNDVVWIKAIQGVSQSYTVTIADGTGTTRIITSSGGVLLQPPASSGAANYEVWYALVYHASKTQWEIWSQATYPSQSGPIANAYMAFEAPGLTAITVNAIFGYGLTVGAHNIDNMTIDAPSFTCSVNPTFTLYDCGTSIGACTAGRTALANVTLTAANTPVLGTVTQAAIAAGHYWAVETSAGTCTVLTALGSAGYN